MNDIEKAFAPITADERWGSPGGLGEEQIDALEAAVGRPVPDVVRRLLRATASSEWAGPRPVKFFGYYTARDANLGMPAELRHLFAFACDGGSKDYVLDEQGRQGRGPGAVFSLPPGAPIASMLRFVAPDLPAFIRWMSDESA